MLAFANAKINLGLNITARRPDGYHEIETVFYPVKLHDVVELTDSKELNCVVTGGSFPGQMEENLCYKAFKLVQQDHHNVANQQITLLKNTPVGAGLGGGSSDAAHVIKLVNKKFKLGLSLEKMEEYAAVLGADCPFFIRNEPVYATGIGEQFKQLTLDLSAYQLLLVTPPIHVSTAEAYLGVTPNPNTEYLPDLMKMPIQYWNGHVKNDFEASVYSKYPTIKKIKDDLYQSGALYASLTGSGCSVYGIFAADIRLPQLEVENKVYYNL
jgi:4-diphosphocytidyl-2-C-methyl-D-erythritol kinase